MKTTTKAKTWCRALVASVALCAVSARAESVFNHGSGTKDYGSGTQISNTASSARLIVWSGTANINTGASIITGGNSAGTCNFVGVDSGSSGTMNINGGTVWCTTSGGGAGILGVGNNDRNVTSYLTLNSGVLKVDGVLRSGVMYDDSAGAAASFPFANQSNAGIKRVRFSGEGKLESLEGSYKLFKGILLEVR